jgi:hypothetical protein
MEVKNDSWKFIFSPKGNFKLFLPPFLTNQILNLYARSLYKEKIFNTLS